MNKKVLIPTVLFLLVLIFTTSTIIKLKEEKSGAPSLDVIVSDSPIVFYFGETCPHCEVVEEYLADNKVEEKISFSKKEVYNNKDNNDELIAKAEICGIKKLGVPFLWDGEKCYVGYENIINFFKGKLNEK